MKLPRTLLLAVVAVAVVAGGWWAWQHWHRQSSDQLLTLNGNVDIRQISLAFEGSDRVAEMRVQEGDHVRAGQVLAVLDTRNTALKLEQAAAQVGVLQQSLLALRHGSRPEEIAQANAQVRAAQAEAERTRRQLDRLQAAASGSAGAVSALEIDNARAQWQAAQAQLDARRESQRLTVAGPRKEDIGRAEAQLRAAQAEQALLQHTLSLAELRAPQNALVRARLLEPGDMASPQRPAYTLALTDPKWVRVYVAEPQLGRIRPGMTAQVSTDSDPNHPIAGRIGFISSVAEFTPKTVQTQELRTDLVYEVRVLVDDPHDQLRLGMPATVHIDLTQPTPAAPPASAASAAASAGSSAVVAAAGATAASGATSGAPAAAAAQASVAGARP